MNRVALLAMVALAGAPAAAQQATDGTPLTCTDIQAGTAKGYNCVNDQLQAIVRNTQRPSSLGNAPYDATSAGNMTGQFNEDATRERLGANFGKSVTPQRPAVNYLPPFTPPR